MHKLVARQIRRHYPAKEIPESLNPLLEAIAQTYSDYDNERQLLERSLELVSQELNERNRELKDKLKQLQETHEKLYQSLAVLDGIFDSTGEAIFAFNQDGILVRYNQTADELLELDNLEESLSGIQIINLFRRLILQPNRFFQELKKIKTDETQELFGTIETVDERLFEYHSTPQYQENKLVGRVWCFRNVTQVKQNEALVKFQAFHDNLTGLPNRALLLDRIEHAIALCHRNQDMLAVLFVDLDHFKKVNDTEGHQTGDHLLKQVAERILGCLREHDTLARFGGDEFVILLESIRSHQLASKVSARVIELLTEPYEIDGKNFHISASVGVSMYPRDATLPQELIRKADLAMYHAKQQGRSQFEFFDAGLERLAHFQLELENKLRTAIQNNELTVYYQPQVTCQTRRVTRFEALLRWFPKDAQSVSPADFIPVAERSGLINDVGYFVLSAVCSQISDWLKAGLDNFCISVNLSVHQITEASLVDQVKDLLKKYQVKGHYLEFEITESVLMENLEKVTEVLEEFRKMDIAIAIDDFGTGYSSLQYLQKLPIDILKVDRSFILSIFDDPGKQTIVNAIVSLGHSLGLAIVAEGVEDAETVSYLESLDCEYIQGYHFYKPLPQDEILKILRQGA